LQLENGIPAATHRRWRRLLTVGICLAALASAAAAGARLVKDRDEKIDAPRQVFGRIAAAWDAEDERALAGLVHGDGLRVTGGDKGERVSHYSPSQAFYYFRNLFQSHRSLLFEFDMMQDATAGERVHGMATWKRRRVDSEHVQVIKLVCTLAREDGRWRLAEINTIR
jgi:hypothetical protein